MNLLPDVVRDFISLEEEEFEDKHADKDYIEVMEEIDNVTFESGHITSEHYDSINNVLNSGKEASSLQVDLTRTKQTIKNELEEKQLSPSFINAYLDEVVKGQKTSDKDLRPLKDSIRSFKYQGKPLKLEDLKETLNPKELMFDGTRVSALIIESASQRIRLDTQGKEHEEEEIFKPYMAGINSLVDKIKEPPKKLEEKELDFDDILGYSNPKITDRRTYIYEQWERVFGEYENLKNAIDDVLKAWGKIEDHPTPLASQQKYQKKESDIIDDLDEEFDRLLVIYNKMEDKYNYVLRLMPFNVAVTSTKDSDIRRNALGFIIDYIVDMIGEKDDREIISDKTTVEIEPEDPYSEGYEYDDPATGESARSVDVEMGTSSELEEDLHRFKELGDKSRMLEEVDPLFAIVLDTTPDELGSYTTDSHPKMLEEMKNVKLALETANPTYRKQLDKFTSRMEEISRHASMAVDDEYFLPMADTLMDYIASNKETAGLFDDNLELIDIAEMEKFHEDLLEVIGDIIEAPTDKSVWPLFVGERESAFGAAKTGGMVTTKDKKISTSIDEFTTGKEAPKRDWKHLTTEITNLVEIAARYYIEPSEDNYYPFGNKLKFLTPTYLTELHLKGPDSAVKTLRRLNLSLAWASIKPSDLRHINAWLDVAQQRLNDPQEFINLSENVMRVMNRLVGEISYNDRYYFAWKLMQLIENNSELKSTDYELDGDSIDGLSEQYDKTKPTIWNLMKYINGSIDELSNNPLLSGEIREYKQLTEKEISTILYSAMNTKLLVAHDEIRKMSNNSIYYANCRLDDYDTMQDTMDLIKSEHGVTVSANDIVGIVSEFDSMESLSKKYGLNVNTVYHIKALYR